MVHGCPDRGRQRGRQAGGNAVLRLRDWRPAAMLPAAGALALSAGGLLRWDLFWALALWVSAAYVWVYWVYRELHVYVNLDHLRGKAARYGWWRWLAATLGLRRRRGQAPNDKGGRTASPLCVRLIPSNGTESRRRPPGPGRT